MIWSFTDLNNDFNIGDWKVSGATINTTRLAGVPVLGGAGVFGKGATLQRKFILPPHYALRASANYIKIGGWTGEKGFITIDGVELWSGSFQFNQGYFSRLRNGSDSNREFFSNFFVEIPHQGNATVVFSSTLSKSSDV